MGRKIVGIFKPTEIKQKLYVYEDGEEVASAECNVATLVDILSGLINEYKIEQVDFCGAKAYTKGLKDICEKQLPTKFTNAVIKINII